MRSIAVDMHMRTDRLNHYKAMGALFVNPVVKKMQLFKRPRTLIDFGADLISMIVPGGNMVDLKSIFKIIKYFAAERILLYRRN